MRISDMNWMQVEEYLQRDDRAVLPLGSTEQHSHLRLTVDCVLPERVAAEAAEPLGIPVFPVVPYGVTPYFREFPGSISLRVETHLRVVRDILDSMAHSGFRRILIVNGHGGNNAVQQFAQEWAADHADCRVLFHNWWNAPLTWAKVQAIDPIASHGSWMENFPWTRLPGVQMPSTQRQMVAHSIRSLCAHTSATETTAACTNAPTRICSRSGRSRSRKPAPCSRAPGANRPKRAHNDAISRLGLGRDRWHHGRVPHARRSEEHTSELQSPRHLVCRL